jgi:beta-glucanase (GH16 family)
MVASPTASPASTSAPAGARLLFDDEFNGASIDAARWTVLNRPGDASNGEEECYAPGNVAESGGVLTLTGQVKSMCSGYQYTSGMVQTQAFNFLYGRVEIRALMPRGQGTWPALWLLGANCQDTNPQTADNVGACQWPVPGSDEVDILEVKGQQPTTDYMTVHSGTAPNADSSHGCIYDGPDLSQSFHTFSLDWAPGHLTWFVDGVERCSQTTGVPSHPLFLIMNLAIGGGFVGSVDSSALPQSLAIVSVRIYAAS